MPQNPPQTLQLDQDAPATLPLDNTTAPEQHWYTGVGDTLSREASAASSALNPVSLAKGLYHSAVDAPTPDEKAQFGANADSKVGRFLERNVVAPVANAGEFYTRLATASPSDRSGMESQMLDVAPEAMGQAGGTVIGGKIMEGGMKVAKAGMQPGLPAGAEGPTPQSPGSVLRDQIGSSTVDAARTIGPKIVRGIAKGGNFIAPAAVSAGVSGALGAAFGESGLAAGAGALIGKGIPGLKNFRPFPEAMENFGLDPLQIMENKMVDGPNGMRLTPETAAELKKGTVAYRNLTPTEYEDPTGRTIKVLQNGADGEREPTIQAFKNSLQMDAAKTASKPAASTMLGRRAGEALSPTPVAPTAPVAPPIAPQPGVEFGGETIHPATTMEPAATIAPKIDAAPEVENKPVSTATKLKENVSTTNDTSFGGRKERTGPRSEAGEKDFQLNETNLRGAAKRLGASNQAAFDMSDPAHQEAATSLLDMKQSRAAELANEMNLKGRANWKADDFKMSYADRKAAGVEINPDKEALIGEIVKNNEMEEIPAKVAGQEGEQSRPFADPTSSRTYGASNKLVSVDEAAQASANFQNKLFRSHAGIDPTMLGDAAKLGVHHLEAGVRELAPTFYSKAAKVAEEKIGGSGSGDQHLSTLRNAGVKESEIKWMGLDDYLAGKPKVSKADLQQFIADNQIQLEETSKGGPYEERMKDLKAQREKAYVEQNKLWEFMRYDEDFADHKKQFFDSLSQSTPPQGSSKVPIDDVLAKMPEAARAKAERFLELDRNIHGFDFELGGSRPHDTETKFDSYTLPGEQKNYSEMLMRLPDKTKTQIDALNTRLTEMSNRPSAEHAAHPEWRGEWDSIQKEKNALLRQPEFKSSHFDEPNILAHVRFNDRTSVDGAKTLFLEEVQSDWHQQGKKQGYQSGDSSALDRRRQEIENLGASATTEQKQEWADIKNQMQANQKGVPDAPFKSDWHELAMKRMLRHAAENGYDKIAWTTGDQQAARYDLSKQLSSVAYSGTNFKAFDLNGNEVVSRTGVTPDQLSDLIGKDAASKLMNKEPQGTLRTLDGLDLKVGGEWAKALYDRAIPNFLNKYGKKWDAKVGETQLPDAVGVNEHFDLTETPGGWRLVDKRQNEGQGTFVGPVFKNGGAAEKWLTEQGYLNQKVHSIDITPAMKKSVLQEGQPISKLQPSIQPVRYDS